MGLYPTKINFLPVIAVLKLIRCQWQLNEIKSKEEEE